MTLLLIILAVLLVVLGLLGILLPALPGVPLIFLGLLLAATAEGFHRIGWIALAVLFGLTIFSFVIDLLASSLGAKRVGASREALIGVVIGSLGGLFFNIPGLILGPLLGAFLGEYYARADLRQAGKVGFHAWLGLLVGVAAKYAIAVIMIGLFIFAFFAHPQ